MTAQEAVKFIVDTLGKVYEPGEAVAISDWLMEHLLVAKKTERAQLQKIELTAAQVLTLEQQLGRLALQEPIQYVLGEAWFCGLKFYVDKNVLIPRPETEELVEWIVTNCKFPISELRIADIGTGSGCIPIALKKRLGKPRVFGYDVSNEALAVASKNAFTLKIDVEFAALDFLNSADRNSLPVFDIIVSNPPYIPAAGKESMQQNVLAHEPHLALFVPDNDPLLFYKVLAEFGKQHLAENAAMYMEIHEDLGESCSRLFIQAGYTIELKKDMQGKDRMLKAVF